MKPLFLIPLLGLAACNSVAPDPRGVGHDETLLTVSATARAEATPDQALFTAGLSNIAANAQAASAHNAAVMSQITAALAKFGVPARDIQTRDLSVDRIGYGTNKGRYEVSSTISVRVRDIGRVGDAIAAVTAAGANIVSGPSLSVADPEKANLGAYGNAYKTARAKAQAYADAANLRIVRVLSIQDGGDGGTMRPIAETMEAPAAFAPPAPGTKQIAPPIMAGTNANIVTVRVDFALAAK